MRVNLPVRPDRSMIAQAMDDEGGGFIYLIDAVRRAEGRFDRPKVRAVRESQARRADRPD